MGDPRHQLRDVSTAAIQTPAPRTIEADRATVFFIPTSTFRSVVPPAPSLYQFVISAFAGIGEDHLPEYITGMELLGKLAQLSPLDGNMMMATFIMPSGHPDAPDEEAAPILSIPVTSTVTDAVVNGGCLTALDNMVYGRSEDGVLFEVAIFIEVG